MIGFLFAIIILTGQSNMVLSADAIAARNGSGSPSWTQSLIGSDANGRTTLGYVEITK